MPGKRTWDLGKIAAEVIEQLRKDRGLTQSQLGVNQTTVSAFVAREAGNIGTVSEVMNHLGLDPVSFFMQHRDVRRFVDADDLVLHPLLQRLETKLTPRQLESLVENVELCIEFGLFDAFTASIRTFLREVKKSRN